jgi:hypothetical protein
MRHVVVPSSAPGVHVPCARVACGIEREASLRVEEMGGHATSAGRPMFLDEDDDYLASVCPTDMQNILEHEVKKLKLCTTRREENSGCQLHGLDCIQKAFGFDACFIINFALFILRSAEG